MIKIDDTTSMRRWYSHESLRSPWKKVIFIKIKCYAKVGYNDSVFRMNAILSLNVYALCKWNGLFVRYTKTFRDDCVVTGISSITSCLLPRYRFVVNCTQHHQNRYSVEKTIPAEGPPIQLWHCRRTQSTYRYHEHYIEHRTSDYTAYLQSQQQLSVICIIFPTKFLSSPL